MRAAMPDNQTLIIIPAYNESATISDVLKELTAEEGLTVLVVDDASSDDTAAIAHSKGAVTLSWPANWAPGERPRRAFAMPCARAITGP
jgi:glycosyltransferase involved in cell wall biosynthesis